MQEGEDVYRQLQRHIDHMPIGFPETESGVELRLLKHLFTPEEAEIALQLSALPESLDRIYKRAKETGISKEKLEETLDHLVEKGAILGGLPLSKGRKGKHYSKAQLVIGMFEFQVDRLTKEFAEDYYQYGEEAFVNELYGHKTRQMRTIPVNQSITPEHHVARYDDTRALINNSEGPFALINCICRQAKDKVGDPCKQTDARDTCLVIKEFAEAMIGNGMGKALSKDKAIAFLDRAEKEGMVLQPENNQDPMFICSCCSCCCSVLTAMKSYPKPVELYHTNFQAHVDQILCSGCEKCVDRCPMDATAVTNGVSAVDLDRCIGCGLCTTTCAEGAITLVKKEKQTVPPKSHDALYKKIMMQKLGPMRTLQMMGKSILGKKI
jgi:Pyruvate/2-oxoacid:ferredoxin oxidoreductase delta subunit